MKTIRRSKKMIGRMPIMNTGNFASRNETFTYPAVAGQVYDLNNISLNNLPSAQILAQEYQYYRITSVRWRLKPNYDTFSTVGNTVLPYLYFLYDKAGSLGLLGANQFEECGAVAQRVDEKTCVRRWRPTVLLQTQQTLTGSFRTSPWLPTHSTDGNTANIVNHLGAVFYISKMNANDATIYDIDITVTVQFRKPFVSPSGSVSKPLITQDPNPHIPNTNQV